MINRIPGPVAIAAIAITGWAVEAGAQRDEAGPERTALDDQPPRMLNAFFGLDNALPPRAAAGISKGGIRHRDPKRVDVQRDLDPNNSRPERLQ